MKVAIIPARGGSKRIPRKNIRPFYGKPIMAYPIETALRTKLFDAVYVSTEDQEIAAIARRYGAALIWRPAELAEVGGCPDVGTQEIARHAITVLQGLSDPVKFACCIYPTTPMLDEKDLIASHNILMHSGAPFVFGVNPAGHDAGQFYWGSATAFLARIPLGTVASHRYHLPAERSVDINTEVEWKQAEIVYANLHGKPMPAAIRFDPPSKRETA